MRCGLSLTWPRLARGPRTLSGTVPLRQSERPQSTLQRGPPRKLCWPMCETMASLALACQDVAPMHSLVAR